MALAILEPVVSGGDVRRFRGHIGSNRFYGYVVGAEIQRRRGRGRFVADASHRSRLFGPIADTAHGRIQLDVPSRLFDRDNRRIQLFSFRTRDLVGPAWSDVLTVAPASSREVGGGFADALPPLTQESAMTIATAQSSAHDAENVAFDYVEAPLASAQFLGVLTNLLPSILPMAGQLLGAIGGGGGGGNGKGGLGAVGALLGNEDFQKKLMEVIGQIASSKTTAKGLGYQHEDVRRAVTRAQSTDELPGGYAEAQVAPALLAALPALMPVLKQMLNPQTIKAINDGIGPNKLTGMVIDGMKDFAKLGIQSHEQDLKHLRALNPGVDDPALDKLLASLSMAVSTRDHEPEWRRLKSVKLEFADVTTEAVHGRDKVMYALGGDMGFPLTLELPDRAGKPRTIPKAILTLALKDPATRKVLSGRRFELEKLQNGPLSMVPALRADKLKELKPGEDYLVTATLTFVRRRRDGKTERLGTSRSLLITAVGDVVFDRVDGSRGLVQLDDAQKHRAFWHKLWQRTFDREVRRVTWATRYVYKLEPELDKNGRLKTLTRVDEERVRHEVGKLKSGMALSPRVLNDLLGTLEGYTKLTDPELEALVSSELLERYQLAARGRIEIDADPGSAGALWLWPEMKLANVVLREPGDADEHGRVRTMKERKVVFPIPAMVHLVSVRAGEADDDAEPGAVAGMKVVEDKKVALYPTQVVAAPGESTKHAKKDATARRRVA